MPDTGPTSERLEALRERWEADPGSRVFLQLADEYRRLGRTEEAARVLEEGLEASPNHLAAQVALGRCQLELGRPEEAASLLEGVIESDPTQMVAYRLLVDAYLRQGRADEARQRLRIYGLLNDSDPEIAELRRRIGELDRRLPEEPEGTEAEAGGATGPEPEPADEEPTHPFQASPGEEPAAPAAGPNGEPFPDLAGPGARRRYLDALAAGGLYPGEELEEETAPPPPEPPSGPPTGKAPGPAPDGAPDRASAGTGEVFDLEGPPGNAAPDLSSLLQPPEAPPGQPPEAPPVQPQEAPPPSPGEPATAPAAPAGAAPEERGLPTLTLGRLYLRQGHLREAEEIFREVLEREPDHAEARRSLEELRRAGHPGAASAPDLPGLEAPELLAGYAGPGGLTDRKRYVLERYLERLRGRAPRDVH